MAWTLVRVSVGDEIKAGQINEVRDAILERQQVVGGTAPQVVNAGDTLLASIINEYRGKIDGLIPDFVDETSGNHWTKAELFESLYGTGRTDWLRRPARDPAGETEGALQIGDICYKEHINEMYDMLNKLCWFKLNASVYEDGNGNCELYKDQEGDWKATRSEAVDTWWTDLQAATITPYDGSLWQFRIQYKYNTSYKMTQMFVPGNLIRVFRKVTIPDYPKTIIDAKAKAGIASYYTDFEGGEPVWKAFASYAAKLFGSATSPGILGSEDWDFGTEKASTTVDSVYHDQEDIRIIDFDHSDIQLNADYYIREQSKLTRPDNIKTADWTGGSGENMGGTRITVYSLLLKLNFAYQ